MNDPFKFFLFLGCAFQYGGILGIIANCTNMLLHYRLILIATAALNVCIGIRIMSDERYVHGISSSSFCTFVSYCIATYNHELEGTQAANVLVRIVFLACSFYALVNEIIIEREKNSCY